jgi:hypothetical protein
MHTNGEDRELDEERERERERERESERETVINRPQPRVETPQSQSVTTPVDARGGVCL